METKSSKAHIAANVRYNRSRDNIMLRPSKVDGACIRSAAAAAGESLQGYILEAVRQRMQAENSPNENTTLEED